MRGLLYLKERAITCLAVLWCVAVMDLPRCRAQERLSTREGLPHNEVLSITQDKQGYLWIGTLDGLCRYDGNKILSCPSPAFMPDNIIHAISQDSTGILWIGSRSYGFAGLDPQQFSWSSYHGKRRFTGPAEYFYHEPGGITWIAIGNTLLRASKTSSGSFFYKKVFSASAYIHKIWRDARQRLIVQLKDNSYYYLQGNDYHPESYTAVLGFKEPFLNIVPTPTGNLYLLAVDSIYYVDIRSGKKNAVGRNNMLLAERWKFFGSAEGNLLAVSSQAVRVFNSRLQELHNLPLNPVAQYSAHINTAFQDQTGVIWLGTHEGLIKLCPLRYPFYSMQAGAGGKISLSDNYVRSLFCDNKKSVWVGHKQGAVDRLLPDKSGGFKVQRVSIDAYPAILTVNTMLQNKAGRIFFGCLEGLYYLDEKVMRIKALALPFSVSEIWSLYEDSTGTLWIGSKKDGLFLWKENETKYQHYLDKDISIWCITEDQNKRIWIGSSAGLLRSYRTASGNLLIKPYKGTDGSGLAAKEIWQLLPVGKQQLYAGSTDAGLSRLQLDKGLVKTLETGTGTAGLTICGLLKDAQGYIWISTLKGLFRYDPEKNTYWHFSEEDGFPGNDFNFKACAMLDDGTLFWGSKSGLCYFKPSAIVPLSGHVQATRINHFKVFDQLHYEEPCALPVIELRYWQHSFSAELSIPEYAVLNRHRFRYMLQGFDNSWRYTDYRAHTVSYTNLPPGHYSLLAQGSVDGNVWNSPESRLDIFIRPAFWQLWWVQFLVFLLLGLSISALIIFRVQTLLRREREKNDLNKRIAELELKGLQSMINPHFVFNAMTAVQHFIFEHDEDSANQYLSRFASLIRLYLESSRHKFIPLAEELHMLDLYISLEQVRFNNKFDYHIEIDEAIETQHCELPTMLLQPLVENAIKHGLVNSPKKGLLLISFRLSGNSLICRVEDNGIGRAASEELKKNMLRQHRSRGMELLQERLATYQAWEGQHIVFTISDKINEDGTVGGTCAELMIPIEN